MVKLQRVAPLRSLAEIEEMAWRSRGVMGLSPYDRVPVARVLEFVIPELIDGFEMRVADVGALGAAEAITDAARPIITFDVRTYNGLYRDEPRPRMTACHEMAHLLLHTGQTGYAFARRYDPRLDPEKQADAFAAAFLMPECAFRRVRTIKEAQKRFGVSRDAACFRARQLGMHRLIKGDSPLKAAKNKGHGMRRAP